MGGPASSTPAEIYIQAREHIAISTALLPQKVWERFVDDVYSILKCTHLENYLHHMDNLHQNIELPMEGESNGELAFLRLSWNGIMESFLYWYIGSLRILTNTYTTALATKQVCKKIVVFSLSNTAHSIITNKDDLKHLNKVSVKGEWISGKHLVKSLENY